jgi:hypothetical protein
MGRARGGELRVLEKGGRRACRCDNMEGGDGMAEGGSEGGRRGEREFAKGRKAGNEGPVAEGVGEEERRDGGRW